MYIGLWGGIECLRITCKLCQWCSLNGRYFSFRCFGKFIFKTIVMVIVTILFLTVSLSMIINLSILRILIINFQILNYKFTNFQDRNYIKSLIMKLEVSYVWILIFNIFDILHWHLFLFCMLWSYTIVFLSILWIIEMFFYPRTIKQTF